MTRVTLYGKPGCHLCDEARQMLLSVQEEREFELAEVDVSLDAGLNRDYGERIPVFEVGGEVVCELGLDRAAVARALAGASATRR